MNNNKIQLKNLKELKNLSYLVPKNRKQDFNNLVNLFEVGAFQNVKTALALAQRLASRGEGPVKSVEKINAMQSAYIKSQTKTINHLDQGIIDDDEPTPTPTPTPVIKLSSIITKKQVKPKPAPKKAPKKEKVVLQSFHITADITAEIVYTKQTKTGKQYSVLPTEIKYNPRSTNEHVFRDVSREPL